MLHVLRAWADHCLLVAITIMAIELHVPGRSLCHVAEGVEEGSFASDDVNIVQMQSPDPHNISMETA